MPAEQSQAPAHVASVPQEVTDQPRRVVVGGVTWRDTFAALKHRNFRLFFVGQHMPARQAFMVEMTSREDLMNAVSLNSSIVNGARVIGVSASCSCSLAWWVVRRNSGGQSKPTS